MSVSIPRPKMTRRATCINHTEVHQCRIMRMNLVTTTREKVGQIQWYLTALQTTQNSVIFNQPCDHLKPRERGPTISTIQMSDIRDTPQIMVSNVYRNQKLENLQYLMVPIIGVTI